MSFLDFWNISHKFNLDFINIIIFHSSILVSNMPPILYRQGEGIFPLEKISSTQSKTREKLVDTFQGPIGVGFKEAIKSCPIMSTRVYSVTILLPIW